MMYLLILLGFLQSSTSDPAKWTFNAVPLDDGSVNIHLEAALEQGWHLYATTLPSDQGPIPTSFNFNKTTEWVAKGDLVEPEPKEEYDINFAMEVRHHSGNPVFMLPIDRKTNETFKVEGELEYMVCNDKTCLPPKVVPFSIVVPAVKQK